MNQISDNAGFETVIKPCPNLQHFQAAYRLTCDQTEAGIIFRLARVESDHPTGVQWSIPVKILHNSAFVKVFEDGAFKWVSLANGVINP